MLWTIYLPSPEDSQLLQASQNAKRAAYPRCVGWRLMPAAKPWAPQVMAIGKIPREGEGENKETNHRCSWIFMDFHGCFLDFHRCSWIFIFMDFYWWSWMFVDVHGISNDLCVSLCWSHTKQFVGVGQGIVSIKQLCSERQRYNIFQKSEGLQPPTRASSDAKSIYCHAVGWSGLYEIDSTSCPASQVQSLGFMATWLSKMLDKPSGFFQVFPTCSNKPIAWKLHTLDYWGSQLCVISLLYRFV